MFWWPKNKSCSLFSQHTAESWKEELGKHSRHFSESIPRRWWMTQTQCIFSDKHSSMGVSPRVKFYMERVFLPWILLLSSYGPKWCPWAAVCYCVEFSPHRSQEDSRAWMSCFEQRSRMKAEGLREIDSKVEVHLSPRWVIQKKIKEDLSLRGTL